VRKKGKRKGEGKGYPPRYPLRHCSVQPTLPFIKAGREGGGEKKKRREERGEGRHLLTASSTVRLWSYRPTGREERGEREGKKGREEKEVGGRKCKRPLRSRRHKAVSRLSSCLRKGKGGRGGGGGKGKKRG